MSTKTTFKRVALVAVAALGFGMLSVVPSSAAVTITGTPSWAVTTAYSSSGASASQTVGGLVTLTFSETATVTTADAVVANITTAGVGQIGSATKTTGTNHSVAPLGATSGTVTFPTTGVSVAVTTSASAELGVTTVVVSSTAVGTQTLTAQTFKSDGSIGVGYTATITWIAATAVGLSATTSSMGLVGTAGSCAAKTTPGTASDYVTGALTAGTSDYYKNTTGSYDLCIYTFDGAGNAIQPATVTVIASKGYVGNSASPSTSSVSGTPTATGAHIYTAGDTIQKGTGTFTAIITDIYGNTITMTRDFKWFGKMATLVLANNYFANYSNLSKLDTGDGATCGTAGTDNCAHEIYVRAVDSNGNTTKFSKWSVAAENITTANLWVKSDKGNGNTSTGKGESNSYATVTVGTTNEAGVTSSTYGGINVACAYGKNEKLTIVAYGYNPTTGLNDIKSNAVDFYCSGAAATVSVTAPATVDNGKTGAVTAKVLDANGYPVYDGLSVTFAATGAGTVAPSTSATVAGVAGTSDSTSIYFIGSGTNGSATVTAIGGDLSGSAQVTVGSGPSDAAAAADAAAEATDAANAATDAANAAAEAADAATAAAQDAADAVAALSAQVATLISGLKSQLTALTNLVIKIQKKVKA